MLPSPSKADIARRNGALSQGPVTAAGKARSARNATRHGLCARTLLLGDGEDAAAFAALRAAMLARHHRPPDEAQAHWVEELVFVAWRQRRLRVLEDAVLAQLAAGEDGAGPAVAGDADPLPRPARPRLAPCHRRARGPAPRPGRHRRSGRARAGPPARRSRRRQRGAARRTDGTGATAPPNARTKTCRRPRRSIARPAAASRPWRGRSCGGRPRGCYGPVTG